MKEFLLIGAALLVIVLFVAFVLVPALQWLDGRYEFSKLSFLLVAMGMSWLTVGFVILGFNFIEKS